MDLFDAYINRIHDYVTALAAGGREVKTFPPADGRPDWPIGPGANPGIILRGDTWLELGNPETGSASFLLFTDDNGLVCDGRVRLIGPDIPEAEGQGLPFGQVILIGGADLTPADHEILRHNGVVGDRIEGYMVRSFSRSVWSRISREAAARGFCFADLGRALMALARLDYPKAEALEVLFVTSGRADVEGLGRLAAQVAKIEREIVRENWKVKGYDIDCAQDCASCDDKPVCDDIRAVIRSQQVRS